MTKHSEKNNFYTEWENTFKNTWQLFLTKPPLLTGKRAKPQAPWT